MDGTLAGATLGNFKQSRTLDPLRVLPLPTRHLDSSPTSRVFAHAAAEGLARRIITLFYFHMRYIEFFDTVLTVRLRGGGR